MSGDSHTLFFLRDRRKRLCDEQEGEVEFSEEQDKGEKVRRILKIREYMRYETPSFPHDTCVFYFHGHPRPPSRSNEVSNGKFRVLLCDSLGEFETHGGKGDVFPLLRMDHSFRYKLFD